MSKSAKRTQGPDSPTAQRLRRLRAAQGYETATAFAKALGIKVPRYLNMEGGMPLTLDVALRIVETVPGCSLDWLYIEETRGLTVDLHERLRGAEQQHSKQAPKSGKDPRHTSRHS